MISQNTTSAQQFLTNWPECALQTTPYKAAALAGRSDDGQAWVNRMGLMRHLETVLAADHLVVGALEGMVISQLKVVGQWFAMNQFGADEDKYRDFFYDRQSAELVAQGISSALTAVRAALQVAR